MTATAELPVPRFRRVVTVIVRASTAIAIVSTSVLLLVTAADVLLRTSSGHGVPGAVEITEVVLVVAAFMGLASAASDDLHIRATLLTDRMRPRVRRVVRLIGDMIGMAIVLWLIYATSLRAIASVMNGEYRFGLISMPIWPARVAILLGLIGLLLALLLKTIDRATSTDGIHDER